MTNKDDREKDSRDNLSSSIRITFGSADIIKHGEQVGMKDRNIKEFFPIISQVFYNSSYYKAYGKGDEYLVSIKKVLPLMSKMNKLGRIRVEKTSILEEKLKENLMDSLVRIGYSSKEALKFIANNFNGTISDKLNLCGAVNCTEIAIEEIEKIEEENDKNN